MTAADPGPSQRSASEYFAKAPAPELANFTLLSGAGGGGSKKKKKKAKEKKKKNVLFSFG